MTAGGDDALRQQALERLGPLASPLAREALEVGIARATRDVLAWEGSSGTVHGHRVVLEVPADVHRRLMAAPSGVDALVRAFAAAVAGDGEVLAELVLEPGERAPGTSSPYRGRAP